jgi:NAD(P)-dependent dehydrogenase (short-subunit alcohol dehydrogenase family)
MVPTAQASRRLKRPESLEMSNGEGDIMTMHNPLDGRVALLTGASGGIGQALALRLAAEGAAVALGYGANAEPAGKLAAKIASDGGRAVAIGADLRTSQAPAKLVDAVEAALGPVEVLVANAGLGRRQEFEEVSADDFDETLAVNLRAPFLLAQRTLPGMRERRFGRVLLMSSVAAFTGGIVGRTMPHPRRACSASRISSPVDWPRSGSPSTRSHRR